MKPLLHTRMMNMAWIAKGYQHIHIEENNHELSIKFLILKGVNHLAREFPPFLLFKNWESILVQHSAAFVGTLWGVKLTKFSPQGVLHDGLHRCSPTCSHSFDFHQQSIREIERRLHMGYNMVMWYIVNITEMYCTRR